MAMIPAMTTGMMDFMMTADDQMVCAGRSDERLLSVLAPSGICKIATSTVSEVISLTFWVHDGHLGNAGAGLGGAVGGAEG